MNRAHRLLRRIETRIEKFHGTDSHQPSHSLGEVQLSKGEKFQTAVIVIPSGATAQAVRPQTRALTHPLDAQKSENAPEQQIERISFEMNDVPSVPANRTDYFVLDTRLQEDVKKLDDLAQQAVGIARDLEQSSQQQREIVEFLLIRCIVIYIEKLEIFNHTDDPDCKLLKQSFRTIVSSTAHLSPARKSTIIFELLRTPLPFNLADEKGAHEELFTLITEGLADVDHKPVPYLLAALHTRISRPD
jgi:hypothetical protein